MSRLLAVVLGALLLALSTSGCTVTNQGSPPAAGVSATQSRPETMGPAPAGRWVKAGPYEVRLDQAIVVGSIIATGASGDEVDVDHLGPGQDVAATWVSVRNPQAGREATLPAPSWTDVSIVDESGSEILPTKVNLARTPRRPADLLLPGPSVSATTPLQPLETYTLKTAFIVPAGAKHLTLSYHLLGSRSPPVLEFVVK